MPDVFLAFEDDDQRRFVMRRLHALGPLTDGAVMEDDAGDRLALDGEDAHAGITRAQDYLQSALAGSGVDPASVRLSAESHYTGPSG